MKDHPVTLVLRPDGDEPVYGQIARQIRERIAAGALVPGHALPPVRVVARDLGVNQNTVARAYRLLEEEGFVRIRDRSGVEVAGPPARPAAGVRDRLRRELREILARHRQAGLSPEEIRRILDEESGGGS